MDPHNNWYHPNQAQYRQNGHPPQEQVPNGNSRGFANAANQTVQNAQQLLASYPMASVGPTVHVARHLSNLNITAAPPSYVQPSYYSSQPHPGYGSGSAQPPPPYTDYNQQLSYLSSPQVPSNQRGYWDDARDTSVRALNEQASQSYNFQPPRQQQQPHWPQSTFQTPPFAQSVFQRTVPSNAYPTPPPPAINSTSSSLAFALGPPVQQQAYSPPVLPPKPHTSSDSTPFFNTFHDSKMMHHQQAPVQHRPPSQVLPDGQHTYQQPQPQAPPPVSNGRHPHHQPPPQAQTPVPNGHHPLPQKPHTAADSTAFFNTFLDSKMLAIQAAAPPPVKARQPKPKAQAMPPPPPPPRTPPPTAKSRGTLKMMAPPDSSPDPLALGGGSPVKMPSAAAVAVAVTPQKRKPVVEIQTPSAKRLQAYKPISEILKTPSSSSGTPRTLGEQTPPLTPSTSPSKSNASAGPSRGEVTPTPKRIVNRAYVSVPPSPYLTPSSSRKGYGVDDTPDLGGYGSEEDLGRRRGVSDSVIKGSARRTGDRDERGPLQKFVSLVEEVFEMEDGLPTDIEPGDLPQDYFSDLSTDVTRPLLSTSLIRKLAKYIGHVARPSKRMRQASGGGLGVLATPGGKRGAGRMADVDAKVLSRLLKMLERSVKAGEDVDPFPPTAGAGALGGVNGGASARSSPVKKSKKKGKANAAREGSEEVDGENDELNGNLGGKEGSPGVVGEVELLKVTRALELAGDSVIAADCCIALLGSDRLPKQLYSEELITGCLSAIKNRLTKIIYPFVEACSPEALNNKHQGINPLLVHIVKPSTAPQSSTNSLTSPATHRAQMSDLFQALSAALPKLNALINAESIAMSDSIIIQTVYVAIGPFFVESGLDGETTTGTKASAKKEKESVVNKTLGKSAMRGLRLDALSLIRSIFANHDDQRSWIIEEILSSLIKLSDSKQKAGQFRLRDGRSIRTVSALLLQLVQTSAHDVRLHARTIEKKRQAAFALKRQESFSESQTNLNNHQEPFLDEVDREELMKYHNGLESAHKAAKTIILFLNSRSGKGKATKNSNEAEYRAIFDHLVEDLLVVLYWPEWPAACLLLETAVKYMVSSLSEDKQHSGGGDSNAAKTMALDHLGVIGARLRSTTLNATKASEEDGGEGKQRGLKPLELVVSTLDVKEFEKVMEAYRDVAAHLCKRAFEDQAYDSARELTAAQLCQELSVGLDKIDKRLKVLEADDEDDDLNLKGGSSGPSEGYLKVLAFGKKMKAALRNVWKDPATDVFDIGSQEEASRIDRLAEEIGAIQKLTGSFNPLLNVVLKSLEAGAIFMRTKALRALGAIVMSDSKVLAFPNVRRGIENGLLDSSPAVRDAAVELIGKYMIDSPEVAGNYYQKIADRMADTGLGVRKRVIKLLKSFYTVIDDTQRKTDISVRLVFRMGDEDDTVKDLAIKTIEELWFPPAPLQSALKGGSAQAKSNVVQSHQDKAALLTKVSVIMGTAAHFTKTHGTSPLEDLLHKIIAGKEGAEAEALHRRYSEICETLIDGLVDASDLPGFTTVNCIRTIYLFSSAYPSVLSGTNASTLLPYLKNASSQEEVQMSEHLLKIFRVSIPHMPKKASKFGQELQTALQPMIIKPTGAGGTSIVPEAVACMCVVVEHITHDFPLLINLLKSCNARLISFLRAPPEDTRPINMLVFIVALLGEHCNYDRLRVERENFAADIDSISGGPILEHIYLLLLRIYQKFVNPQLRGRVLQCLGYLFRAQPTLMTKEQSAEIMDAIFDSPEEEGRGRLLKIMQGFLTSESEKHSAKEKEMTKNKKQVTDVNMDELVGNTDGFADSGVSSAIVQRYLTHILDAALSTNSVIQFAALDVLTFTIKQGLAHPLQSFPVIIALETSTNPLICNRAAALHAIVNAKHASLVNTRFTISARKSFDYQKKIVTGPVKGFRTIPTPVALLQRWYFLVREKRNTRQDFLKAMVKVFSENESFQATQDDVEFTRYMAENFATFEYKTQEEVFTIIKYLTTVLSTTGMQLLDVISPSHLLTHLQPAPPPPSATPSLETIPTSEGEPTPMEVDSSQPEAPPASQQTHAPYGGRDPVPLMRTSVIIAMVMLLKAHLKALYSLSEDKCNKFVVGKKSAIGDKPATKKHENPISWDRLPYAVTPVHTVYDAEQQKSTFLEIWNEDGVQAEPEDEELLL